MGTAYEGVDYNDPLSLLLQAEGEDTDDLESMYDAGCHVSRPRADKDTDDMLGASPFELHFKDIQHEQDHY